MDPITEVMMRHFSLADAHQTLKNTYRREFREIFKTEIDDFIHPLFGFQMHRFTEFIRQPSDRHTQEYLMDKFGPHAVDLILDIATSTGMNGDWR